MSILNTKQADPSKALLFNKQASLTMIDPRLMRTRSQVEGGEALHGLRGVACIVVVLYHSLLMESDDIEYGYGPEHKNLQLLPFIRVLFAGRAMTRVFFVLSGYILSFEMLKKSAHGLSSHVHEKMASAMLKRGIRLFMPPLATTFITMLLFNAGAFDGAPDPAFPTIRREGSFLPQLSDWVTESGRMVNFFRWHTVVTPYNPHLWTLAHEYRGSMLLYGTLMACSKVKVHCRVVIFFIILLNATMDNHLEIALFFCGAILAETVISTKSPADKMKTFTQLNLLWIWYPIFLTGLYLVGYPVLRAAQTTGYRWLARAVPFSLEEHEWWHSVGSLLVVAAIVKSPTLQQPLLALSVQRLGDISFSIYLIHNPVIRLMIPFWVEILENFGLTVMLGKTFVYLLLSGIAWPVLLSLSWVVFNWVDKPSMWLARWVEERVQVDDVLLSKVYLEATSRSA